MTFLNLFLDTLPYVVMFRLAVWVIVIVAVIAFCAKYGVDAIEAPKQTMTEAVMGVLLLTATIAAIRTFL